MRKLIVLLFIFTASVAIGDTKVVGHQTPLPSELLKNPLRLINDCGGIFITEWKNTFSNKGYEKIKSVCDKVSQTFYPFVRSKGYKPKKTYPTYKISLLPWTKYDGGIDYRGLNDIDFRFKFRTHVCGPHSDPCKKGERPSLVKGYTEYNDGYIYIRNDISSVIFAHDLAHELFHVFSYLSGVQDQESNYTIDDEVLAYEYTDKYWPEGK